MSKRSLAWSCVGGRCAVARRLRHRADGRGDERQGGAGAEGVVQGARPGGPRPPRPGRDAEDLHRLRDARRRPRTSPRRSRRSTSRRSSGRPTASTRATGRTASASRRRAAASSAPTIPKGPVGGNCYACHQLAPQEVSYGTIGPPLYQFGKIRGYNDDIRKYAYGKIWNADAYTACSNMPRFGHSQILTEAQIKDLVALLMDPDSPVNK